MPSDIPSFGVDTVFVQRDDVATALPDLSSATLVTSTITPSRYVRNAAAKTVGGNGSYKVAVACFGVDAVNGGYTFGIPTAFSSAQTPTSGQGVLCRIASSGFGALTNLGSSIGLMVFVQKGSANPQAFQVGILDTAVDFSFLVMEEPSPACAKFTTAALATPPTPADKTAGSRLAKGVIFDRYRTSGGVRKRHLSTIVNVSPDDSVDYPIVTARAVTANFNILSDSIEDLVQAAGGNYVIYTDTNSQVVTQGSHSQYITSASVTGNKSILFNSPQRGDGTIVTELLIGNVVNNQQEYETERRKDQQAVIPYTLTAASIDRLLIGMMTGSMLVRL